MKQFGKLFYLCALIVPIFADSKINCDFEEGSCGWSFQNGWFSADKSSNVDPGHDHTCMSPLMPLPCGKWLSTISNFNGEQDFILKGPQISPTAGTSCFSFWYHFFGLEKSEFKVMINNQPSEFNAQDYWAKRTPQGNNWVRGYVSIPKQASSFYIIIKATLSAKYKDTVGLDDITFTQTACPQTTDCDLEGGLCGWTNHGFQLTNSSEIVDHTTNTNMGRLLLNKGSSHMAQISIPAINLTSPFSHNDPYSFCFVFWYYFSYDDEDQNTHSYLQVNNSKYDYYDIKLTLEDVFRDDKENSWNPFYFHVSTYYLNKAIISISSFTNGNTQIAIDDLQIKGSSCPELGSCDFETDMCGWSNNLYYKNALWVRNTGGTRTGVKHSPIIDMTTKSTRGWFAMVPSEQLKGTFARLQSPPLKSPDSSCFSFYYYAIGNDDKTPVLRVYFRDLVTRKTFAQATMNTTTNTGIPNMGWSLFNVTLDYIPPKFYISIMTVYMGTSLDSDIAIDNISFRSSICGYRPHHTSTTTAIPFNEKRWNCNFEYNCHSWMFDSNWKVTSYSNAQNKISTPRIDHTHKNSRGKYLLWSPSGGQLPGNGTTITSTINSTALTNQQHCLSFWYYDSSEIKFQLSVYTVYSITRQIHEKTVTSNYITRSWKLVRTNIYSLKDGSNIQILFSPSGNINGSFAIDDITVTPGMCGHFNDYTYTFDSYDDIEVSRIRPLHYYMGTLFKNNNKMYPLAPKKDFTTGTGSYFLFMNQKDDFNTTYEDLLTIHKIPATGYEHRQCVRFAFQLNGNGSLNAYITPSDDDDFYSSLLSLRVNHKSWVVAEFSYTAHYEHKLILQMVKPFDLTSYIALDDLSIISGHCNQDLSCDFDDDICSFYFSYSQPDDYEFARFIGPPQTASWPGPGFDHTRRTYGGGYLYMTGYPSIDARPIIRYSIMRTPIRQVTYYTYSDLCFSLWTFITQPDASLTVELELFSPKNKKDPAQKRVTVLELSDLSESKWTQHNGNIDSSNFTTYREFSVIFTGQTKKANTFIAIDDIQLEHSGCDYKKLFSCSNHQKIDYSLICNFHDDCSDGSDEKGCGDCNFEAETCGWISDDDDSDNGLDGTWKKVHAQSGNGPNVDGSGKANGDFLILVSGKKSMYGTTVGSLTRDYSDFKNQFKLAYFTCTMTFDYYLEMTEHECPIIDVMVGNTMGTEVSKTRYDKPSKQWQKGIVYIGGFTGTFTIKFLGVLLNPNSTLAIDNIKFNDCSIPNPIGPHDDCPENKFLCNTTRICIDPNDLCDFEDDCGDNWDEGFSVCSKHIFNPKAVPSCDFENSIESCGFSKDIVQTKTSEWKLDNGNEYLFSDLGGPSADHTVKDSDGRLVTFYAQKQTDKKSAEIYSPMMTSDGDCSMRFFYYNNGQNNDSTNELKVRVRFADKSIDDSGTLFSSNSYVPNWIKGKAHYKSSTPFQFVFKGTVSSTESSISIDDVSFTNECIISDAVQFNSEKHSGATAVIVIVVLVVLMAAVGYFLYRRSSEGRLSLNLAGLFNKRQDQTTLANANYNN